MTDVVDQDLRPSDPRSTDPRTGALAPFEPYRRELTGYCYRMLGSTFDADDAVQDTMVRAWQAWDGFEGRASVRSWLYRIATNTCLDALRSRSRRALPMDLSSPVPATTEPGMPLPETTWLEPAADGDVLPPTADPADLVTRQESVRLAFVAALQYLPPRQRTVLILRDVLCWQASEVAQLLETSVASVNSALQRARTALGERRPSASMASAALDEEGQELLERYVACFESYDIDGLLEVLSADASLSMPPLPIWLKGAQDLRGWYLGHGIGCKGSRLVPLQVNGSPAYAQYKPDPAGGLASWSIQVLELAGGRVQHVHHFLDPALFARFGLPARLD